MISLCAALVLLPVGFLLYGRLTEKVFAPDDRETPAIAYPIGAAVAVVCFAFFLYRFEKVKKNRRLPMQ